MKMKTHLTSLVILLGISVTSLSAGELENLRALCAEQEMQIRQLEEKIARLTDSPPPPSKSVTEKSSDQTTSDTTYTVKPGDNIERIAKNHKISASTLYKINNLKSTSIIYPGQKIKLPTPTTTGSVAPVPTSNNRQHTIKSGETFYRIAKEYGITVDQLSDANSNVNHNTLKVGQVINIPTPSNTTKAPEPTLNNTPSIPILNKPAPVPTKEPTTASERLIKITTEITYSDFATAHNTTTQRLDELNDLNLSPTTVLAQGSELYVPAQP